MFTLLILIFVLDFFCKFMVIRIFNSIFDEGFDPQYFDFLFLFLAFYQILIYF